MKILNCRDAGVDCDYVVKGKSEEDVIQKAMDHGRSAHPDRLRQLMADRSEHEVRIQLRSLIRDEQQAA